MINAFSNIKISIKSVRALLFVWISLAACSSFAATAEDVTAACDAADSARKQAAKVKMEWRDTKKMIKKARKTSEKGDHDKAIKLCETAKFQGEAGVAQADSEGAAWMARVPK